MSSTKRRKACAQKGTGSQSSMADDDDFIVETRDALPAHLLIKIQSFSTLWEHGIREFESREFDAGDYKWKVIMYPDGHKCEKNEGDYISAYLSMAGRSDSLPICGEVNAIFNICLCNQILDNYRCVGGKVRRFHPLNSKWGFSKFISKKSLTDPSNGYIIDDNCVFGAEVFVIKSQQAIECVSILKVTNPYKHEWKISQFSKLKDFLYSQEFSAGGYQWKIQLFPNGSGSEQGRSVSIYVYIDSRSIAHQKVKADVCMRIKNNLHNAHRSRNISGWFGSEQMGWGWRNFIPTADMHDPSKGFVVNDCCIVETEISVRDVVSDQRKSERVLVIE